jgi:hypothetical protein
VTPVSCCMIKVSPADENASFNVGMSSRPARAINSGITVRCPLLRRTNDPESAMQLIQADAARHLVLPYSVVTAVCGDLKVQFVLGVFVFVVVIGLIDAKLPWPEPRSKDRAP